MIYLLDTNVISALRRPYRTPNVQTWLSDKPAQSFYLPIITVGELEKGIARQAEVNPGFAADLRLWIDATLAAYADRILPFDMEAARIWGRLAAKLGHSGSDMMIAAIALSRDATVVTRNVRDFQPTGCRVENPF